MTSLPLVVCYCAYLQQPAWLVTGWDLWQAAAPFVRDYFLVKPAPSLNAALPAELTYEQASRQSRRFGRVAARGRCDAVDRGARRRALHAA